MQREANLGRLLPPLPTAAASVDSAGFALAGQRVGMAKVAGGSHRWPRQIGLKHAMGVIPIGLPITADEGGMLGFVNEMLPAAARVTAARRWTTYILACGRISARAKRTVAAGLDQADFDAAFDAQAADPAMTALFRSADMVEGRRSFARKRPPACSGT